MSTPFSISPLAPVGAEVVGLPAGGEDDPDVSAALYDAWLVHGALLFRNIETSVRHLALSRCFGELEMHPAPEVRAPEDPLLTEISGVKKQVACVYDGTDLRVDRQAWHRDSAFTPNLCKGAMLRMLAIPSAEGETLFADTAAAYDDLRSDIKARIETLEYKATIRLGSIDQTRPGALWKTAREATEAEDPEGTKRKVMDTAAAVAIYPPVVHPVVLLHPESGRKCIYLSPTYVDYFLGMEQSESDELLAYLVAHLTHPRYVYKHRWVVNDALIWDNRRFMHAAAGYRLEEYRRALRTTLTGEASVSRYFNSVPAQTDRSAQAG